MPTVTALSQLDFVNLGPLTSTFTAPAACATNANRIGFARPSNPGFPALFEDCELPTWGDCIPNGAEIDKDFAERDSKHGTNAAVYYHAGSICPDSWTTAGLAAKNSDGKLSTSGIYAPSDVTTAPKSNPTPNIFVEALGPGETAIFCCPSGYTANEGVGCHSTLPNEAYTADEVCRRSTAYGNSFVDVTFTYAGEAVTGIAVSEFPPTASVTSITTAAPRKGTAWLAATYVPAVTLVHGGGDGDGPKATETSTVPKPKPTESSKEPKPTETSKEEPKPTETKPADDKGNDDKGDDKGDDSEVSSSATKKVETKTSDKPKPTSTSPSESETTAAATPSKGFTTSKTPASGPKPTPSPGGQPDDNRNPNGGDDTGASNPGGNGSDGSGSNGSGGAAGDSTDPPSAGSARWGSMTATVTAVWGLAAVSGMLLAAL